MLAMSRGNVERPGPASERSDGKYDMDMDPDHLKQIDVVDSAPSSSNAQETRVNESVVGYRENLCAVFPEFDKRYKVVDRLGEGTFASVFKAVDNFNSNYDNGDWMRDSKPSDKKPVFVAVKQINSTSSPSRILNELDILISLRGSQHIAFLIESMRFEDQVFVVMPYMEHQDFRLYFRCSPVDLVQDYFRNLFQALAFTHRQNIIHRDVKPANFLFDVKTRHGLLCDFGLAQRVSSAEFGGWHSMCLHSLPSISLGTGHHRQELERKLKDRKHAVDRGDPPGLLSGLHGRRLSRPVPFLDQVKKQVNDLVRIKSAVKDPSASQQDIDLAHAVHPNQSFRSFKSTADRMQKAALRTSKGDTSESKNAKGVNTKFYKEWRAPSQVHPTNIMVPKHDRRPTAKANRAGTRGFRAPEILFKCPDQTVAVDIWSAGVTLLSFMTGRFPFFNATDDLQAIIEIASFVGRRKMDRCAVMHNRSFLSNIPTIPNEPALDELVTRINPEATFFTENSTDPYILEQIRSAFQLAMDLLKKCLEPDLTKRPTAEDLLLHPFFDWALKEVDSK